jgi:molybdenum cofactor cytidylyltransferase
VKPPFTGRSNLVSNHTGVLNLNPSIINKINALDESITVATLENFDVVTEGQMLATIKIIPFSVTAEKLADALNLTNQNTHPLIQVFPFKRHKVGVISTALPETKESVISKSEQILQNRLRQCGNDIDVRRKTPHHEDVLAKAIQELLSENCDLILIFGASAITDRNDVIPTAIKQVEGTIEHFGMPVDPGNLLLLAHKDQTKIVGLPGCTRSPKMNGFDWVLQRLLAGINVGADDIMGMGVGGLLKEISSRPQPRQKASFTEKITTKGKSIAILILAAGQSRRMGANNKLLAEVNGKPMLQTVAEQARKSKAIDVYAVTGHEKEAVERVLAPLSIKSFHNPDFSEGLSSSLKTGFTALADEFDGLLVCLGDMPFVDYTLLDRLIDAFDIEEGRSIIVPTYKGKRGNPVLIAGLFKPEIMGVTGDIGAKSLIAQNEHVVFTVDVDNNNIFRDIDTLDTLLKINKNNGN